MPRGTRRTHEEDRRCKPLLQIATQVERSETRRGKPFLRLTELSLEHRTLREVFGGAGRASMVVGGRARKRVCVVFETWLAGGRYGST